MDNKIVDLRGQPHPPPPPVPDFWFAQVDQRLSRIEIMMLRLEWQIWLVVGGCAGLLIFQIVTVLSKGTP